jgi:hypothetical protein
MEAHYDGHLIRVSALRVPHTAQWTFALVVSNHGADEGVKTFTDYGGRFDTAGDAVSRGYDFAMKWIDEDRLGLASTQRNRATG